MTASLAVCISSFVSSDVIHEVFFLGIGQVILWAISSGTSLLSLCLPQAFKTSTERHDSTTGYSIAAKFDVVTQYTDSHNLIPDFQHGFRSETSTNHQLLRLTNRVINGFNSGDTTGGGFLDVEKAFDRVWHDGLIFKMIKLNFPSYIIHLINSYLSDRTLQVKILATLSRIETVSAESPQGSNLSPMLYNIYTHDFPTTPTVDVCLFADDAVIIAQACNPDMVRRYLQQYLKKLQSWLRKWRIKIESNFSGAADSDEALVTSPTGRTLEPEISSFLDSRVEMNQEEEFVRAQLFFISKERVERETEEKISRQHAIQQLRWESELNELRLEIESIRSNVKRTSCAEDRKKTSSNYRIHIGRSEEHMRETSTAVLMAEATMPVITPIKEEKGMEDLRVVHVKVKGEQGVLNAAIDTGAQIPVVTADVVEGQSVDNKGTIQITSAFWEHEIGELKGSNTELNDLRHGVVPVSKNLVNDILICSSDYEGLIENSQMVRNPAILREPSGEEGIINSVNSESVCSLEVVTDLFPETYTQSLIKVQTEIWLQ
ncbi:RNA-directed DNA polymerase from mobile element jockey [Trichonephila clavipes]|nr:RNA-directed DNA polymerase from mobile element jockey [Trichonephila clavipes]